MIRDKFESCTVVLKICSSPHSRLMEILHLKNSQMRVDNQLGKHNMILFHFFNVRIKVWNGCLNLIRTHNDHKIADFLFHKLIRLAGRMEQNAHV